MGKLDGKVALITVSDSGIGRTTAFEFARYSADFILTIGWWALKLTEDDINLPSAKK